MASRTSGSTGLLVAMTLTLVLFLASFVTSVVFYGKFQRANEELAQARSDLRTIIRAEERQTDRVRQLVSAAGSESLVTYLDRAHQTAMQRVTGMAQTTPEQFLQMLDGRMDEDTGARAGGVAGADTTSLIQIVRNREQRIAAMERELAESRTQLAAARSDLQSEVERVGRIRAEHDATLAALKSEIQLSTDAVTEYRGSVATTIDRNNARVEEIRRSAAEQEDALGGRIAQMEQEMLVLQEAISHLRAQQASGRIRPTDEFALVDGRIVGSNPANNEVFISLGRADRIVVGMTFEVYDRGTSIRPDEEGEYPLGKAAVEVIRINQGSSTARVIRDNPRNPIVDGDFIANPLYDPDKIYTFLVFGNFDTNRDGNATAQEAQAIIGIISEWGGRVVSELTGSTDFLVLGERPILPPEPGPDSPLPVIQDYIRKKQAVEEYDRLFGIATQTSIPILNQNRLYTMTGLSGTR